MPVVTHLIERTTTGGENDIRNDIKAMILAIDDAVDTTSALILARGVTVAAAAGIDLPDGYFDTERIVATIWNAAGDYTVFDGGNISEAIA